MRIPALEKCVRWQSHVPLDLSSEENDTFPSFVFESRAASHTSNTAPDSLTPASSKLHKAKQGKKHLCERTAWNPTRRWQLRPKGHIDVYINRSMHNKYWAWMRSISQQQSQRSFQTDLTWSNSSRQRLIMPSPLMGRITTCQISQITELKEYSRQYENAVWDGSLKPAIIQHGC